MAHEIAWPKLEDLPCPATRGTVSIDEFEITEEDAKFSRLRAAFGHGRDVVQPGKYLRLTINGCLAMSNTQQELIEASTFVRLSYGHVLVLGLGLGVILHPIARNPRVVSITVVEKNPDVVHLTTPSFMNLRADVGKPMFLACDDAETWQPPRGARYDSIWIDIWNEISDDHIEQEERLLKKYRRFRNRVLGGDYAICASWLTAARRYLR